MALNYKYGLIFRPVLNVRRFNWCAFMKDENSSPILKFIVDLYRDSVPFLFHQCPYTVSWSSIRASIHFSFCRACTTFEIWLSTTKGGLQPSLVAFIKLSWSLKKILWISYRLTEQLSWLLKSKLPLADCLANIVLSQVQRAQSKTGLNLKFFNLKTVLPIEILFSRKNKRI